MVPGPGPGRRRRGLDDDAHVDVQRERYRQGGALVSPGEFYGPASARFIRVAVVQPDHAIELVADRLGVA
jgi:aspartate/methionine/tyrosine aminotransferase